MQAGLIVCQIALSIVLLTGAALLTQTVTSLLDEDAGIEPRQALVVQLALTDTMSFDANAQVPFVRDLLERVRRLPGVQHAGVRQHSSANGGTPGHWDSLRPAE